jgi:IS5 family transposase
VEHELIKLYLLVCDFYDKHSVLKEQRLSNNSKPAFSDPELLTMYIFGHLQGFNQQRQIYHYFSHHWRAWFPALPSYQAFNYRLMQLITAFELLIEQSLLSAGWQISATDDRLIDSVPVMLARGTRANQSLIAPELASTGFCAVKQQHYRGVKIHFIAARRIGRLPLPEKIHFSEAAQHDLAALRELSPRLPQGSALFADKAYFHRETERYFKEAGWFLLAAYKRHRFETEASVPTYYNRFVSAVRQPLESLFNWLIQKTDLQNASRVRSDQGLKVHCYGKLAVACLLLTSYS